MVLSRVMRFSSNNVFNNLAAEECIFQKTRGHKLLFYVNSESVVLGRTQNPFNEADVAYAAAHSIPIVRRRSGGGTVVHDGGNLNFCFMRPRAEHEPLSNAKLVAAVLREDFGIQADVNDRADIIVDGKKVSGAAYRISRDRAYHHGTLLVNSNLDRLRRLLKSPLRAGIETMGTKSVPSPVTKLADHYVGDLLVEDVIDAIAERYSDSNSRVQPVTPAQIERECEGMQREREELCNHAWVYGQAPKFSSVHHVGDLRIRFEMTKGAIVHDVTCSQRQGFQMLSDDDIERLKARLKGIRFDGPTLGQALTSHDSSQTLKAISNVLRTEVPPQFWIEEFENSDHAYMKSV